MKYRSFVRDNDAPRNYYYYYRPIVLFLLDAFKERETYEEETQLEETVRL